jgi:hypothetical protein
MLKLLLMQLLLSIASSSHEGKIHRLVHWRACLDFDLKKASSARGRRIGSGSGGVDTVAVVEVIRRRTIVHIHIPLL